MQITHEQILACLVGKEVRIANLEAELATTQQQLADARGASAAQDAEIGRLRANAAKDAADPTPTE